MTPTEAKQLKSALRQIYQAVDYAECSRIWDNLSQARRQLASLMGQLDAAAEPYAVIIQPADMHAVIA